jgi:hypothetical protein
MYALPWLCEIERPYCDGEVEYRELNLQWGVHRRPGTAKGYIFNSMEDETGIPTSSSPCRRPAPEPEQCDPRQCDESDSSFRTVLSKYGRMISIEHLLRT